MFGKFIDDLVDDPIGTTWDTVTQPVRDACEVATGLTEGQLRMEAATRLGVDAACGMAASELIEWYQGE